MRLASEQIEQLDTDAFDVGDVAGDQRQSQDPGRGGQQAVDDRQRMPGELVYVLRLAADEFGGNADLGDFIAVYPSLALGFFRDPPDFFDFKAQ